MKAYREMEVQLHTFLLSALDEKWSASRPDRFTASEPLKNEWSGLKSVKDKKGGVTEECLSTEVHKKEITQQK
jgi:hypothetical protein